MTVEIPFVENLKPIKATYKEQEVNCPFCNSKVVPVLRVLMTGHNVDGANLRFLARFPCCNKEYFVNCDKGDYRYNSGLSTRCDAKWTAEELPKEIIQLKAIPEIIDEISPNFRSIFEEAQAAQHLGYTQICGGGYRKALEFLIKDYATILYPDKDEEIKKMELGNCISQYVDNDLIKCFANRASWLGNDELHYLRKWEELDLLDLEGFIDQAIMAIDLEERRKELERSMPKPKKDTKNSKADI